MRRQLSVILLGVIILGISSGAQQTEPIKIQVGTIVPKATAWEETLQDLQQEWRKILGPRLNMRILAGGGLGDETALIMKMRNGQIQAVGVSAVGLNRIDPIVNCLQIPLMFESWAELDYVRDRVTATLEARIEKQGYKLLHWADGGWIYPFSISPAPGPDDVRKLRLFTSTGDPTTERLYGSLGFKIVVLPITDVATAIERGTLEAIPTVPLFAMSQQLYKRLIYMTDIPWMPLIGGTVISGKVWERLPPEHRPALATAARIAGDRLRTRIRGMDAGSIKAMEARGLKVVSVDDKTRASWRTEAERAWSTMSGSYCQADVFDEVKRLRAEYRSATRAPSARPSDRRP